MWPARSRRGLTLAETLIAAGLFSLVLAATYASLLLAVRFQQKHDDSVTVYQTALRTMNKMEQALSLGAEDSMVVEPEGFVFISAGRADGPFEIDSPSGEITWQKAVCFFIREGELFMKEDPGIGPTTTLPPTPTLAAMMADTTLAETRLATGVTELVVTADASAELRLRVEGKAEATNAITLQNRLNFRI